MKQKIVFSLFLVAFLNSAICLKISAQYLDFVMSPYWEFYSTNSLSSISAGKGNTGVASSGDVSLIYLNLATLNISNKFQVNAGYNLKSESGYTSLSQNFYSFSLAGAYRLTKNLQVGLAYQNDYSYKYLTNSEFQDTNTFETHSFRVPVVYEHKWLRFGMNINLSYYKASYSQDITGSFWKLIPEIGTVITPIKEFSFGASFIPGFKRDFQYKTDNTVLIDKPYAKFPNRIKIGTEVRLLNKNLKLSLDYHYANTGSITYLKDQSNYNIGLDYIMDENLTLRCGFFTMFDFEDNIYQSSYNNDLYFVTIGTSYKFNNYSINLGAIGGMSGHSGGRDYFVINFGAGYEF